MLVTLQFAEFPWKESLSMREVAKEHGTTIENHRGFFCLATRQPGQAGCVMSHKLVIPDAYFMLFYFI